MEPLSSINREQRLYVMKSGAGFSCYGFDVLHEKGARLAAELGETWNERRGTKKAFAHYALLVEAARVKHAATGWRSKSELHPQLVGLEGRRVEVVQDGERRRFIVGKSTGWIPCHLEIHNRRSSGGGSAFGRYDSVTVVR